jgi:MoaA/NifB/PqqE/SkfB family radical SAM enzyme
MIDLRNLSAIDIETINNCNAKCPLCLRTANMKTNDSLDWAEIIKQIPDYVWQNVKEINLNGTTGDNLMHPGIYEIVQWLTTHSPGKVSIHTNGSIRDTSWWSKFGKLLSSTNHRIVFALDGLEDTHYLYRIDTNWNKIIENAKAFIAAGGRAEWQFILFDHNKHQVDRCRELANEFGFSKFFTIYQDRFDDTHEIKTKHGIIKRYDPKKLTSEVMVRETSNNFKKQRGNKIECRSQKINWVSIYADGTVWPCCWLMGWHVVKDRGIHHSVVNHHLTKILKIDFSEINLYNKNLEDIINSELWQKRFTESFDGTPNLICKQQCSK